jgi:hypothetical protein
MNANTVFFVAMAFAIMIYVFLSAFFWVGALAALKIALTAIALPLAFFAALWIGDKIYALFAKKPAPDFTEEEAVC